MFLAGVAAMTSQLLGSFWLPIGGSHYMGGAKSGRRFFINRYASHLRGAGASRLTIGA
jgi:hypothetical protein